MANKKTIAQLEERRRKLLNRLVRTANELQDIDITIRKMRNGKLKQPAPPAVTVKFSSNPTGLCADTFGDLVPTFGE